MILVKIKRKDEVIMKKDYKIINAVFNISTNGAFANTNKEYCFLCFDDAKEGDIAVVETQYGLQLVTIVGFTSRIPANIPKGNMKEVVAIVDMAAFVARKEKEHKLKDLKARMKKRVQQLQEDAVYEMMAKEDDELSAMLKEYKELQD